MNKLGVCYQRDTEDLMLSQNSLLEEKACNSVVNIVLEIVSFYWWHQKEHIPLCSAGRKRRGLVEAVQRRL